MNWNLLLNFTRQDLVDRHSASMLGAAWIFLLLPLATLAGAALALLAAVWVGRRLERDIHDFL